MDRGVHAEFDGHGVEHDHGGGQRRPRGALRHAERGRDEHHNAGKADMESSSFGRTGTASASHILSEGMQTGSAEPDFLVISERVPAIEVQLHGDTRPMTTFSHSGDFTETIFHLPILQQKDGGELVLYPQECTSHRMTRRAAILTPLCEVQPYVRQVRWAEQGEGLILDDWRQHKQQHLNLTDLACESFGVPFPPREQPWLFAVPNRKARVIFHRSPRHQNWNFEWNAIYDKYNAEAVFVGLAEEHADFCHYVGPVSFVHTTNLLQLAEIIQGCELFIGNQSCPYAIAEGLKVPTILEIGRPNNCHWERVGNIHAWDRNKGTGETDDRDRPRKEGMESDERNKYVSRKCACPLLRPYHIDSSY